MYTNHYYGKLFFIVFSILLSTITVRVNAQDIIPRPVSYKSADGSYVISAKTTIGYADKATREAAAYLAQELRPSTGLALKTRGKKSDINLLIDTNINADGYRLEVSSKGIFIVGGGYRGVVNGIQTLRQLLPAEAVSRSRHEGVKWEVASCTVYDEPRYDYRGLMLDVSRHFYTKEEVKRVLDFMALYKMNKFHWHLTDDQGWRIEIKRYPKLTESGAWRTHDGNDRECNRRAKAEDNADMEVPSDRGKTVDGEFRYGGFYTQDDIREVVEYARVRGIDVIPEIDMPGHMLAAISNYSGLSCSEKIGWGKVFSSPVCPGKDTAMEFCKNVYDEVTRLFPYGYVHIGGDEVEKIKWKSCPDCQKRMKDNGLKTEEELQSWFIHEMEAFINSKGKKMIGWNEIIEGGLSKTSTIMWWGSWVKDVPEVTTAHGNDLIFTPNSHFYLDYTQGADDIKKIYTFDTTAGLPADRQKHLLGVQGNIWCEQIPTIDRVFYMTSTRALAIAELGWSSSQPKNYYEFEQRLIKHLPRLRQMDVKYKIMPLEGFNSTNAFVGEGRYRIYTKDPSASIRYTADGSIPDASSSLLDGELRLDKSADITFRTFYADGSKGDITRASFVKDEFSPAVKAEPVRNGLTCRWYDFAGADVNKITEAKLNDTFVTPGVEIPAGAKGNIGLVTTGYIYLPMDDIYTFALTSDDGSVLKIDGNTIVDMNREQAPTTSAGEKALAKGYHRIEVRYFDHNGGRLSMTVRDSKGNVLNASELFYSE